jgi:hypothetical protein
MMRPIGQFVVIEQIMTKKKTLISLEKAENDSDKFDFIFKIIRLGPKCENDIKVGEMPILSKHRVFQAIDVLERFPNQGGMRCHALIHENDIVGIDEPDETKDTGTSLN